MGVVVAEEANLKAWLEVRRESGALANFTTESYVAPSPRAQTARCVAFRTRQ
jgi:hypothetical protein